MFGTRPAAAVIFATEWHALQRSNAERLISRTVLTP